MKHITYASISQFRHTVKRIKSAAQFQGLDEEGTPIYNTTALLPTVAFKGTPKIHGNNASICYNSVDGLWVQSRNRILTVEKDTAGFAFYVESNKSAFLAVLSRLHNNLNLQETDSIAVFGEWAGMGIQKGAGVTRLPKAFYVFGIKLVKPAEKNSWLTLAMLDFTNLPKGVFSIELFPRYTIQIDFNRPDLAQKELAQLTEEVEAECPIVKYFGLANTVGEGIVWTGYFKDQKYMFKVKGEKHSSSKVKTLASSSPEKIESIAKFVKYAATENRFNQAIEQVFTQYNKDISLKEMGKFLKWVNQDVVKEEMDVLLINDLTYRDVVKEVEFKARSWFLGLAAKNKM